MTSHRSHDHTYDGYIRTRAVVPFNLRIIFNLGHLDRFSIASIMKCVIEKLFLVTCILAILSPLTNSLNDGSEKVIDQHQRQISLWNLDPSVPCVDLSGTWYNQHGSKVVLENLGGPIYPVTLGGTYRTAVYVSKRNETDELRQYNSCIAPEFNFESIDFDYWHI